MKQDCVLYLSEFNLLDTTTSIMWHIKDEVIIVSEEVDRVLFHHLKISVCLSSSQVMILCQEFLIPPHECWNSWVLKLHNISLTAVAICCNLFGSLCQTSHCTFPYFINICLYFSLSTYIYVESSNKQPHTIFISSSWSM